MSESGQNKRDYDVMMDNIGCYSPIDHADDSETNVKRTKNLNDNKIQTQVLSPPNSEPVSSCTVINSNNSSSSHIHSSNENEEDDKTIVNDAYQKSKLDIEKSSDSIKKENIDSKEDKKSKDNNNDSKDNDNKDNNNNNLDDKANIPKKEDIEFSKSKEEDSHLIKEDSVMPPEHVKICTSIIRNIKRHHDSGPFLKPVDPVALCVPDYFTIIHHPMDISTIESKLKKLEYKSIDGFIDDFTLMFKNCYEYNGTQQPVSLMAKNLEISFNNQLNHYYHEINNSSEESSQQEIIIPNIKKNESLNTSTNDNDTSTRNNRSTGGKTTTSSKRKPYNSTFYSYLYKKSSSRLMKLTGEMVVCKDVINEILKKRYEHISYPFLHPVDPVALNIPDYPLIIKTPMDISTIQEKLDSGIYLKKQEFEDDFRLIFKNCYQYNPEGTDVYILGKQLEEIFNEQWNYYNDRYEKSLQAAEAAKLNTLNKNSHSKKPSTTSHTSTPVIATTSSRKNSHTSTNTMVTHDDSKEDIKVDHQSPKNTQTSKRNHNYDHKSQSQQPLPIPNHAHATTAPTPKTSSKSKKRSISTTTASKAKISKTTTTTAQAKPVHKPVKREIKKKGTGKVVKKRKVSVNNDSEEKAVETLNDYEKVEESDNDYRLKLEIEELQKTLQTCTARLTMLLEQKSDSLNKKLPPTKKSTTSHTNSTTSQSTTSNTAKNRRKASSANTTANKKVSRNQKNTKTTSNAKSRNGGRNYVEEPTYPDYEEEEINEIEEEEEVDEESPNFYDSYVSTAKSAKKKSKKRKTATTASTKPSRKNSKKATKRSNTNNSTKTSVSFSIPSLNMDQKREISDCINKLPAEKMCEVVQIIQESIPLETGQEEIELDIESFDNATLWKLYQFVKDDQKKPKMKKERSIRKRIKEEVMDQSDSSNILSDSDSDDSSNSSEES